MGDFESREHFLPQEKNTYLKAGVDLFGGVGFY